MLIIGDLHAVASFIYRKPSRIMLLLKLTGCAGTAEANGHIHVDSNRAAEAQAEVKPKTPQEWVELLVQQMAGAKDLDDARSRASQILQAFEQAVLEQASQVCDSVTLPHESTQFTGFTTVKALCLAGSHQWYARHGNLV